MGRRSGYIAEAIQWGVGLAFVLLLAMHIMPLGVDDFSEVFWPAGRAADPYASGIYFYPVWCTWVLRFLGLLPREVGLMLIWSLSLVVVLTVAPVWDTPLWVPLLAPPFVKAMCYGHPFEALVLAGVSLVWLGWHWRLTWVMGMGLALCLFKPHLGWSPVLVAACSLALDKDGRRWLGLAVPVGMVIVATSLEWAVSGVLWVGPWWGAVRQAPQIAATWNVSRALGFEFCWFFWLPIGLWLVWKVQDFRRRLWVAMAFGLLLSPYWCSYILYPLVAMAGCWRSDGGAVG